MKAASAAPQQISTKQTKAERGRHNTPSPNTPQAPAFETLIHVELAQSKPAESAAESVSQTKPRPEVEKPEPSKGEPRASERPVDPESVQKIEEDEPSQHAPEAEKVVLAEHSAASTAVHDDDGPSVVGSLISDAMKTEPSAIAATAASHNPSPAGIEQPVAEQPTVEQSAGEPQVAEKAIAARQSPSEETVAVARDPLGLMPRQEAAEVRQERGKDLAQAKSDAAAKIDEPRHGRAETVADASRQPNTQSQQSIGMSGAVAVPLGVARAMPVANTTGGTQQAGNSGFGQANSLAGLTGRQSIWKLENAGQKPGVAVGKANPESQVARAMVAALRHKGGVVTLRLSPDELGQVRVELRVEDGKVSAVLDAQDERARGALHAGIDTLRKSLEASGLTITHLEVVGFGAQTPVQVNEHTRQNEQQPQHNPQQAQDFGHHGGRGSSGQDGRGHSSFGGEHAENSDQLADAAVDGMGDGLAWSLRSLRLDTVV